MPIEASIMMFCVVLCLIAVALARTEDVYDFTEFERSPMRLFIQGRDHYPDDGQTRLVRMYRCIAGAAAAIFAISLVSLAIRYFMGVLPQATSTQIEATLLMFLIIVLFLVVLLMKLEAIWTFTTIVSEEWDKDSEEAQYLNDKLTARIGLYLNFLAGGIIAVPITAILLVLRLFDFWGWLQTALS
jgi:hypothetical protein